MKVYWNTLLGNLTQAEKLPNRIKAGFKVSCCLYHTLKTWQRKFFGLGPHKRNQGKWKMVEENRWTWTSYTIRVMLWLPKIPAWMPWKLSSSLYFPPSSYECHTWKKNEARKSFIQRYRGHICQTQNPTQIWELCFKLSSKLSTLKSATYPSERQFSSSKKGSSARFRKKGQKTPCTSISSWKTTCQWVKWTRIRHIWIEFPLKYSWGPSWKGGVEEGWEFLGKSKVLFCRPQTDENTSKMSTGQGGGR